LQAIKLNRSFNYDVILTKRQPKTVPTISAYTKRVGTVLIFDLRPSKKMFFP
jgi:hypothetical protein